MKSSAIRVLIVDDFKPWRRFLRSAFEKQPQFTVVGEVSDGLLAAQKAEELRPDLILLDVSLPRLNGIDVARRIRRRLHEIKILFVSENHSPDIAQEALRAGGDGYVVKSRAARELLPAIEAVLRGEQFSMAVEFEEVSLPIQRKSPSSLSSRDSVIPVIPRHVATRHEVAFYEDDIALVEGFANTTVAVLAVGDPIIHLATEPHRASILERLGHDNLDVDIAIEKSRLIQLDAGDVLATIMTDDGPDPARCIEVATDLIGRAEKHTLTPTGRITICSECAPALLSRGNVRGAIHLERLWDEFATTFKVDTFCGYCWSSFPGRDANLVFQEICAEHNVVQGI